MDLSCKPVFYYTDNQLSQIVANAFAAQGIEKKNINDVDYTRSGIFYGIHRGAGFAQEVMAMNGVDYYYVDNGYYDAKYIDGSGKKDTTGTYRICKNSRIHSIDRSYGYSRIDDSMYSSALFIPPSPYTAFINNTTPNDWLNSASHQYRAKRQSVRDKGATSKLEHDILDHDLIVAFNSIAILKAVELHKEVATTHGIFSHIPMKYSAIDVEEKLKSKQYTLAQIEEGTRLWM